MRHEGVTLSVALLTLAGLLWLACWLVGAAPVPAARPAGPAAAKLVGAWWYDNGATVYEVHLLADGRYYCRPWHHGGPGWGGECATDFRCYAGTWALRGPNVEVVEGVLYAGQSEPRETWRWSMRAAGLKRRRAWREE